MGGYLEYHKENLKYFVIHYGVRERDCLSPKMTS